MSRVPSLKRWGEGTALNRPPQTTWQASELGQGGEEKWVCVGGEVGETEASRKRVWLQVQGRSSDPVGN